MDFGCGDCNQLKYIDLENVDYSGIDVSKHLIDKLKLDFEEHDFHTHEEIDDISNKKLTMSIDVIYHLVNDNIYHEYMVNLFNKSNNYVLVYSTDINDKGNGSHVKHRKFTDFVRDNHKDFELIEIIKNETELNVDFYLFKKI